MSPGPDRRRRGNAAEPSSADRLVTENLGLVYDTAKKLARQGGHGPERGDLISAGVRGLIQAASTFEPERGLAFSTHAVTRIRGAMLDELRRWDKTPRSVRKKERTMKEAETLLWAELKRRPTVAELAEYIGVEPEEIHGWETDVSRHVEDSLDRVAGQGEEDGRLSVSEVIPDEAPDASDELGRQESVDILGECLQTLPERERRVLALYYYEELRLREIAELLGVTESRVSQIRSGALKTLRSMMTQRGVDEP